MKAGASDLSRGRVDNRVGIKKELLPAEREIVDSAHQSAVVKNSRSHSYYSFAGLERIVGGGHSGGEIISISDDCFVLIAQPIADHQIWQQAPLILSKKPSVGVLLG